MSSSSSSSVAPSKLPLYVVLAAFPLICIVVGFAALPRPVTTSAAREGVDRSQLSDVVQSAPFSMATPLDLNFERIRLEGVKLPQKGVTPNSKLNLEFFFEATKEMNRNWQLFVHIDRKGQSHRIHGDHYPAHGRYPTTLWKTGEHVRDQWSGKVGNAPPGEYEVWLGFYIGDERMKFRSGKTRGNGKDNRVLAGTVEIPSR